MDVVRSYRLTGELLGNEVHLVGALRAGEHADRVRSVGVAGRREPGSSATEGFVPRGRAQLAVLADEWLGQPLQRVISMLDHLSHLPSRLSLTSGRARRARTDPCPED